MKEAKCRACGKTIAFIRAKGKRPMPVDPEPIWIKAGRGYPFILANGSMVKGEIAGDADDDPDSNFIEAYVSHFATCTDPDLFRRR